MTLYNLAYSRYTLLLRLPFLSYIIINGIMISLFRSDINKAVLGTCIDMLIILDTIAFLDAECNLIIIIPAVIELAYEVALAFILV